MANQPKKYQKFVATAATATLVAAAIVPTASAAGFNDTSNYDKETLAELDRAVELGFVKGYDNGDFKPNAYVTRGQVAKIIARHLVSAAGYDTDLNGLKEYVTDFELTEGFTDVPEKGDSELFYASLIVKAAGAFTQDTLNPGQDITRQQMAKVLVEAFELEGTDEEVTITDLDKAGESFRDYITILKQNDVTKGDAYNPLNKVKRIHMASFTVRAYDAAPVEELVEVAEVAVKNETTLEVKVAEANKDLTVEDFAVTVDGKEVKVSEAKADEKGEVYTLTIDKLEGKGEVEVNGVKAAFDLTVAKIESTKAVDAKTIEVTFNKAVDTEKATVELFRGNFKQNATVKWAEDNKSVKLIGAGNYQAAEYTVKVTGLTEDALTDTVKVEAQKVTAIEILSDVAVLSENDTATATATVGYVVKDQYGTDITKTTQLKTNDAAITASNGKVTIANALINGKKIGDSIPVVLIHSESGVTTTQVVKLSAKATVASVKGLNVIDAQGKEVALKDTSEADEAFLQVELTDQYGEKMEAKSVGNVEGIIVTSQNPYVAATSDKVEVKTINGKNVFVVPFKAVDNTVDFRSGSADVMFITTANGEKFTTSINVEETVATDNITIAQPEVAIQGEAIEFPITVLDKAGNPITDVKVLADPKKGLKNVTESNLKVKDGQVYYVISKDDNTAVGYKTLVLTSSTNKVATLTYEVKEAAKPVAVRGFKEQQVIIAGKTKAVDAKELKFEDQYGREIKTLGSDYDFEITAELNQVVTANGKDIVAGSKNGSAVVTINLLDTTANKTLDSVEQTVRVTDGKEYKSYEVKEEGLLDVKTNESKELTVYGVLDNGGKVQLATTEFTGKTNVDGVTVDGGKLIVAPGNTDVFKVDGKDVKEREVKVTFTINNDGSKVEQTFKISKEQAKVQDFYFTTSDAVDVEVAKEIKELEHKGAFTIADTKSVTTDQYGVKGFLSAADTVTIVPADINKVNITDNGTANAKVEAKEATTVTVKATINGVTKELKVKLTPQ